MSDQLLIIPDQQRVMQLQSVQQWAGHCTTRCGLICKKEERILQSIGEVIYIDKDQDWAKHTAFGNSSLHWERRGEERRGGDGPFDCNMIVWVDEVRNPRLKVALNATSSKLGKQSRMPDTLECLRCVQEMFLTL